jgi:hypothetical protein
MENIAILLDLFLRAAAQMQQYAALINKARAEGRDVTREELDDLYAKDDAARASLQALIDARSKLG